MVKSRRTQNGPNFKGSDKLQIMLQGDAGMENVSDTHNLSLIPLYFARIYHNPSNVSASSYHPASSFSDNIITTPFKGL